MTAPSWQEPNLARNPFVNERPVRRLAVLLWLLAATIGAAGFWRAQTIRQETGTRVAELARLSSDTASTRERAVEMEADLRKADLGEQNRRVEFLNRRFAERAFSWNLLLDTLTHEMPRGVRLLRLSPQGFARERGRGQAGAETPATTRVELKISGEAEETEALLEFVDRLFQAPAFDEPNLSRESTKKDTRIQFEIAVDYLPEAGRLAGASEAAISGSTDRADPPLLAGGPAAQPPTPTGDLAAGQDPVQGVVGPSATRRVGRELQPASAGSGTSRASGSAAFFEENKQEESPADPGAGRIEGRAPDLRARGAQLPAGGAPVLGAGGATGSGSRGGSTPAPGARLPAGGGQQRFPGNVLPTPLKPYASSLGGGR